MDGKKVSKCLQIGGAIFTVAAVVFGATVYWVGMFLDQNFAYMAVFYDDMAMSLRASNASSDAVALASVTAVKYCALYSAERRNLDYNKYRHLCDAIGNRTLFFIACYEGIRTDCSDEAIPREDDPMAAELLRNQPYMSFIFNNDFYKVSDKQRQGFLLG